MLRPLVLTACLLSIAAVARPETHVYHSGSKGAGAPTLKGSGREASETRAVQGAHALRLESSVDVTFSIGTPEQVVLTGDDNVLPLITSDVDNGTLVIGVRGSFETHLRLRADVRLSTLDGIEVRGSGDVTAAVAETPAFGVKIKGSGDVAISDMSAATFSCRIEGSGDAKPSGRCTTSSVEIKGSGDFLGSALACDEAVVTIAGSGDADIDASKKLDVTIRGSGDVRYAGSPALTQTIQGSGDVTQRR